VGSGQRILVLAARQPEFTALLEDAGFDVEVRSRPAPGENLDADLAVVFRGRLIGRQQAVSLRERGIPVVEVLTVEPPGTSRADWVRLSNRIPKSDLVQVVHAVASWARSRVGAAAPAA
jgi:hypothetical protein